MKEPIPDDIRATVDALCEHWLQMREAGAEHGQVAELIGRALLAERRRWMEPHPVEAFLSPIELSPPSIEAPGSVLPFRRGVSRVRK